MPSDTQHYYSATIMVPFYWDPCRQSAVSPTNPTVRAEQLQPRFMEQYM